MSIIVDGYNYIGRSQDLKLSDPGAGDTLIYLMGQYCSRVKKTLTLVFDGNYFVHHANRRRRYGRVTVIYTSPIYTADETIKKMIKNQEYRRRKAMLVVSSDDDILQYAQSHGTTVVRSEDFERQIYQEFATKKGVDRVNIQISHEEVREWLNIFGPDPGESPSHHEGTAAGMTTDSHPEQPQTTRPRRKEKKQSQQTVHAKKRTKTTSSTAYTERKKHDIDRIDVHLSQQEVQEWMQIFGVDEENQS